MIKLSTSDLKGGDVIISGRTGSNRIGKGVQGRSGHSTNQPKALRKKKFIEDYSYYVSSSKQASDFDVTNEYVINYIKKLSRE